MVISRSLHRWDKEVMDRYFLRKRKIPVKSARSKS